MELADQASFRAAMGRFATGVAVVTTRHDGFDHAMTASSFTSVSLDPLLVLVCIGKDTRFGEAVAASQKWAVSILDRSQEEASRWFATRGRPLAGQLDRFPYLRGRFSDAAMLDGALAGLECQTSATYDAGDHVIVVGEVHSIVVGDGSPLLYYRGGYRSLGLA
jgi:flavin reductase